MVLLQDRIRSFKQPCRESGGSAVQRLQRLERSDLTSGERRQLAGQANNYDISSCSPQAVLHLIRIQIWLSCIFFFPPCSLGNSSEKLGRYWALTVWKESAPSPPLCFAFDLKYPSVTVFCKPIIHLWLLKTLFPGLELARGSQSLQLPAIGAFLTFVQPELSAWKRSRGSTLECQNILHCLKHQRNTTKPAHSRFYSFPKPECLT